jgi:hypothetical protein
MDGNTEGYVSTLTGVIRLYGHNNKLITLEPVLLTHNSLATSDYT